MEIFAIFKPATDTRSTSGIRTFPHNSIRIDKVVPQLWAAVYGTALDAPFSFLPRRGRTGASGTCRPGEFRDYNPATAGPVVCFCRSKFSSKVTEFVSGVVALAGAALAPHCDGFREDCRITSEQHLNRNSRTFTLIPTLMLSIGLLVLISVGSVVTVNWFVTRRIVQEFASRLITRVLSAEQMALREHLDAAIHQADFVAHAVSSGRYRFSDPALADFVGGSLAAAPQAEAIVLSDPEGNALRASRGGSGTGLRIDRFDVTRDSQFAALAALIRTRKDPHWGPPVYRKQRQETFLNYRVPIWNGDAYLGFVAIGISTVALSTLAKQLSDPPRSVSFMLYDHDRVLAHPLMTEGSLRQSETASFPPLRTFGDPIIANFGKLPPLDQAGLTPPAGVLAGEPSVGGEHYLVFAQEISDYGDLPITIGTYFLKRAVDAPIRLFYWATILTLGRPGHAGRRAGPAAVSWTGAGGAHSGRGDAGACGAVTGSR